MIDRTLMLLFPDLMGDYLMFRNVLEALRDSDFMSGRPLVFVGNKGFRPLVEAIDAHLADRWVWLEAHDPFILTPKKLLTLPWRNARARKILDDVGAPRRVDALWCPSVGPWGSAGVAVATRARRKVGRAVENKLYLKLQEWVYDGVFHPDSYYTFMPLQHQAFIEFAGDLSLGEIPYHFPRERFLLRLGRFSGIARPYTNSV